MLFGQFGVSIWLRVLYARARLAVSDAQFGRILRCCTRAYWLVDLGKLTYWGIRSSSSWEKRWPCLIETAAGTRRHPVPRGW